MAKMEDQWDMNMGMLGKCWENVGKMLGKCWENVGKMLGKWGCERDFNGISLGYS